MNVARGAPLPAEIAFLANYGHPVGALVAAAGDARRFGVSPYTALVASGDIAEEAYFSALARHFGVAYCDQPDALGPGPGDTRAIAAGVAAVAPGANEFVLCPQGAMLTALFQMQRRAALPRARVTFAPPRQFARWVRRSASVAIASDASSALQNFDAGLSAARGASRAQIMVCLATFVASMTALALSPVSWFIFVQIFTLIMTIGVLVRLYASIEAGLSTLARAPPLPDAALPTYTLIIALYREAAVVDKLVAAIERIDYPRARLDVKFVVEEDDAETQHAFAALGLPAWCKIIVAPPGEPRTKPRALNVALPFTRGELVTVYDAEDEPEPDQLRLAAARFAQAPPEVACLQASLAIDNSADSWLTALFAIEYAALFDVVNRGLTRLDLPMPLGGTSNHFRGIR